MTAALISALICTVALLVVTAYAIMGSAPQLVLIVWSLTTLSLK